MNSFLTKSKRKNKNRKYVILIKKIRKRIIKVKKVIVISLYQFYNLKNSKIYSLQLNEYIAN